MMKKQANEEYIEEVFKELKLNPILKPFFSVKGWDFEKLSKHLVKEKCFTEKYRDSTNYIHNRLYLIDGVYFMTCGADDELGNRTFEGYPNEISKDELVREWGIKELW